tara:strand:- start:85 stop:555 length:471 start_codon:yes stop_codon:yes gene_type:complete
LLNLLKNIFDTQKISVEDSDNNNNLNLLCGLMIEAANTDGEIDQVEVDKIVTVLVHVFKEDIDEVNTAIKKAIENRNNSKSLFYYTSKINKQYTIEQKLILIEALWEIVLSDGKVHDYETSLIRRLSGLLYISDVNSGNAKKRALDKIKLKNDLRS